MADQEGAASGKAPWRRTGRGRRGPGSALVPGCPQGARQGEGHGGGPASQPFPPGKHFDASRLLYLKVRWGTGERNESQEH